MMNQSNRNEYGTSESKLKERGKYFMKSCTQSGSVLVLVLGAMIASLYSNNCSLHADTVLILADTVFGDVSSLEAQAAENVGYTVEVVDSAGWLAKSQAQFASYRALILGDPNCVGDDSPLQAAVQNRAVWSPVVKGNIIIVGTDPVLHALNGNMGALKLSDKAVAFQCLLN